jgi:Tfp pilus assembly protein PilV
MLPKFKSQAGISLIEIVITVMVVGFVVLTIANVPQAIQLVGISNHESLAKDIITKKIEDLRNQGYSLLSNGTTQISDSRLINLPQGASSIIVSDCSVTICANNEHTKQVEVKVTWNEQGKIKNVDIYTLISEGGLK